MQVLLYVFPSQPQTGSYISIQVIESLIRVESIHLLFFSHDINNEQINISINSKVNNFIFAKIKKSHNIARLIFGRLLNPSFELFLNFFNN